jgi:hypothetical protein
METLENIRRGVQLGERDRPGAGCRGVTKHCIVTTGISGGSSGTLLDAIMVWRATRGPSGCHGREPKAWNDRHGLGDEPCGDARNFCGAEPGDLSSSAKCPRRENARKGENKPRPLAMGRRRSHDCSPTSPERRMPTCMRVQHDVPSRE